MAQRKALIPELKRECAALFGPQAGKRHRDSGSMPAEAWCENLPRQAPDGVRLGRFDSFGSARQIVEAAANNQGKRNIRL